MDESDDQLAAGHLLANRYEIVEHIADGAMASVYRATDRTTGAKVAIKIPGEGADDRERFSREARVLSEVRHTNVVAVLATHVDHVPPFYVMELAAARIEERRATLTRSPAEALDVFKQICAGVAELHRHIDAHRDLSNRNVLMLGTRAVVCDLGLAKFASDATRLTTAGARFGTPMYMSPEQMADPSSADARSDIYALGKLLHELVTGSDPVFLDRTAVAPEIARVIARATQQDRTRRYQTVAEFLEGLARRVVAPEDSVLNALKTREQGPSEDRQFVTTAGWLHRQTDLDTEELRDVLAALVRKGQVRTLYDAEGPLTDATAIGGRLVSPTPADARASAPSSMELSSLERNRSPLALDALRVLGANAIRPSRSLLTVPLSSPSIIHDRRTFLDLVAHARVDDMLSSIGMSLSSKSPERLDYALVWRFAETGIPWRDSVMAMGFDGSLVLDTALWETHTARVPAWGPNGVGIGSTIDFAVAGLASACAVHRGARERRPLDCRLALEGVKGRHPAYDSLGGDSFVNYNGVPPFEGDTIAARTNINVSDEPLKLSPMIGEFLEALGYWASDFKISQPYIDKRIAQAFSALPFAAG